MSLYVELMKEAGLMEGKVAELSGLDEIRRAIVSEDEAQRLPQHNSLVEAWSPIIQSKLDAWLLSQSLDGGGLTPPPQA